MSTRERRAFLLRKMASAVKIHAASWQQEQGCVVLVSVDQALTTGVCSAKSANENLIQPSMHQSSAAGQQPRSFSAAVILSCITVDYHQSATFQWKSEDSVSVWL